MSVESPGSITVLLESIRGGDSGAYERLIPLVYDMLRRLAEGYLEGEHVSLTSTELVHEAYLRLAGPGEQAWENRRHFYWAAGEAMRRVLVDRARARHALKRGGGHARVSEEFLEDGEGTTTDAVDLLALDEALRVFETVDPRAARVTTLRFFAGADIEHAAAIMQVSSATIKRDWAYAKAWLYERINSSRER